MRARENKSEQWTRQSKRARQRKSKKCENETKKKMIVVAVARGTTRMFE